MIRMPRAMTTTKAKTSGKMVFALDNFTSNNVALWSYEKITCISDTLYFHILAGDNLLG